MIIVKVLFKNITKYDEDVYTEFLEFHQKVFKVRYWLYTLFIIGLLLILITFQLKKHNIDIAIGLCAFAAIFFLWRYLHPISLVSKEFDSDKIQNGEHYTFDFYENILKIRENNKLERYVIKYKEFYKVFETNNFFYLYVDKTHSLLIDKSKFIIGSSEDFSEFIKKKCKYKYKLRTEGTKT